MTEMTTDDREYLEVTDTTCSPTYPRRTHDIMVSGVIRQVTFEIGQPQLLPIDVALRFLKDDAFVVTDPRTGKKYDPTPPQPDIHSGAAFALASDEVVAKLDELTQEALFIRSKQMQGAEDIKKGTPKEKLISFLARSRAKTGTGAPSSRVDEMDAIPGGDLVGGAMGDKALAVMIPDDDESGD
jgi:hypothetical protein